MSAPRPQSGGLLEQVLEPSTCRIAVVAAHPDDETVSAGGQLPGFEDVHILHLTDGAPRDPILWSPDAVGGTREQYARLRAQEAEDALALAGIPATRISCLGVVEHEAALQLPVLAWTLMQYLEELEPDAVLLQPYEGGHPDHDATAFSVHVACALLHARRGWRPSLVEMSAYHGPNGQFACGDFLPGEGVVATVPLSDDAIARKREMLACFASQRQALQRFPVGAERFRMAPRYDFTTPPHRGQLYYEVLGGRLTGERFRQLAREALEDLSLEAEVETAAP
jgi:LmbE family N-acetylglucosaminyl deacetylase